MPYLALAARYRDQPSTEIFAHFGFAGNQGETWEAPYEKLVTLAKPEGLGFPSVRIQASRATFSDSCGIFKPHVFSVFKSRTRSSIQITTIAHASIQAFKPRTKRTYSRRFFAIGTHRSEISQPGICTASSTRISKRLTDFRPLPSIATYIESVSDLVLDTSCEIEVNYDHLFDDIRERLPNVLKDNQTLAIAAIQGSLEFLKEKILRNYKLAIPHWYRGHTQLLLPLNLTSEHEADLALVAEKDQSANLYRIKTALQMDMAYMDARLITRPDRDWLNP